MLKGQGRKAISSNKEKMPTVFCR